mgnify:CR=1 FL=1
MPRRNVDPITLSVVRGVLETTQREMTLTLDKIWDRNGNYVQLGWPDLLVSHFSFR